MTKVNIREALNQIDKDTDCKYDLVTLYEGYNFNDEEKKEIAKMISDNEDAEVIYDRLSNNFGEDANFDDDDISDISLDECDMNIDTEEYLDFDDLDEDTIKTSKGKWVNKGEEGTHGTFDTKKEADAQRRAMFAAGWKGESLDDDLLKEDWHDGTFTDKDFQNYTKRMTDDVRRIAFSISYMIQKHDDYAELFDNLVEELVTILRYDSGTPQKESLKEDKYTRDLAKRLKALTSDDNKSKDSKKEKQVGSWKVVQTTGAKLTVADGFTSEYEASEYVKDHGGVEKLKVIKESFDIDEDSSDNESLKEASYGGAYDIADDEYFTKDDGMEAANEVAYQLEKEFPESRLEVMDMQLDNHSFYIALTDKDGNEFSEEITLDMRKIRHPLDLIKKYAPALTERFIKQINDYYSEM